MIPTPTIPQVCFLLLLYLRYDSYPYYTSSMLPTPTIPQECFLPLLYLRYASYPYYTSGMIPTSTIPQVFFQPPLHPRNASNPYYTSGMMKYVVKSSVMLFSWLRTFPSLPEIKMYFFYTFLLTNSLTYIKIDRYQIRE